ncbi:hypothetical protein W02_16420 [Nitrospira sp. KM1]|nr:hypothetical protein W02_16420 [Nitrospira sp. KM1]
MLTGCLLVATSCSHPINWYDQAEISRNIAVKYDDIKQVTSFIGPNCALEPKEDTVQLRAVKGAGISTYQIYISDRYDTDLIQGTSGWRLYSQIYDDDGSPLSTTVIARNPDGCGGAICSHIETISAEISREYLEHHKASGVTLKVRGKAVESIFFVPSGYIQAFLAKVS